MSLSFRRNRRKRKISTGCRRRINQLADLIKKFLTKPSAKPRFASPTFQIKRLVSIALDYKASDIHLEPKPDGLRVRFRIDGVLRDIQTLPLEISRPIIVALKVMSNIDIAESRRPQDGRIGEEYRDKGGYKAGLLKKIDLRVSTLPCLGGEKAVIRLLPKENPFSNLESLGFSETALSIYKQWIHQSQGLIIITGPTGSGKTSTLNASLRYLGTPDVNIVTVEDPIEYASNWMTQTQINYRVGVTFADGLRAILRQDPDIIMVGEIRDEETVKTVMQAALTGHLVFSTLHTRDAFAVIPRLYDLGTDMALISELLLGVVLQRLIRRVCPFCAQPYTPTDEDLRLVGLTRQAVSSHNWRRGQGCYHCFNSGYLGREAIVELLDLDKTARQMIRKHNLDDLPDYLSQLQSNSFRVAALDKLSRGITTLEELIRVLPHDVLLTN